VTLNLARRPFANLRPLRRLAIGLWALGGVAAAAALWLFAAYLSGSAEKRAELGRLQEVGAAESQKIAGLEGELGRFDLAAQNREVAYINDRISERTFGWSALFDDLADVLPWNVRIESLSPLSITPGKRPVAPPDQQVEKTFLLRFGGTAKDGEALLTFVDRLFAHPAFAEPDLEQERRENGEELRFTLTVTYRPHAVTAPTQFGPASSTAPPPASAPGALAGLGTAPEAPAAASPSGIAGTAPSPNAAAPAPAFGVPRSAAAAAAEPPARGDEPAPAGEGVVERGEAEVEPAAPVTRGWIGVDAGQGTTAEVPVVDPRALAPAPPSLPLPLAPTMSSTIGIR
jgi:Tfp pilus assembly protein PilN